MDPAVEPARADPVSEGIYHEGECKGSWDDVGIGRRGVGWAICPTASLSALGAFLVTQNN
jgi:hypothetical protein